MCIYIFICSFIYTFEDGSLEGIRGKLRRTRARGALTKAVFAQPFCQQGRFRVYHGFGNPGVSETSLTHTV